MITYATPLRILPIFILLCLAVSAIAAPVDGNFSVEIIESGNGKTKITQDEAGRLYVAEKQGRILLFTPDGSGGFNAPTVLMDLTAEINADNERGLLGMVLDPSHNSNRYIYLFYSTDTDQRLVRYTQTSTFDGIEPLSSRIILSGLPNTHDNHKAGDIGIHPLDPNAIFIMIGDDENTWPDNSVPRNPDYYEGKILRVERTSGLGLNDNPYYDGDPNSIRSRVWAVGFRNPFRFAFHPIHTDILYVSENGSGTDRIAWVKRGGDGLWNGFDDDGFLTVDTSSFKVLETLPPSIIGIELAINGPFAHNGEPTLYVSNWYPQNSGTLRYRLSGTEYETLTPIDDGNGGNTWDANAVGVDLEITPDGNMYFTSAGRGESTGTSFHLERFVSSGDIPPTASFTRSPNISWETIPFTLNFTDTSVDGDNPIVQWEWTFGDGSSSTLQNPSHTYTQHGVYAIQLKVTDDQGLTNITTQPVVATQTSSVTFNLEVKNANSPNNPPGAMIIALYQENGYIPIQFIGGSGSSGNLFITDTDGLYSGTHDLPLFGDAIIMEFYSITNSGLHPRTTGLRVIPGLPTSIEDTYYLSTTAKFGRVTTYRNEPATIDIGLNSVNENDLSPVQWRDYLPDSHFIPKGYAHRITTDELGYYYMPFSAEVFIDTRDSVQDTGWQQYAPFDFNSTYILTEGSSRYQDYKVAEYDDIQSDDLSSIAYNEPINFSAIQTIFNNNCVTCHNSTTGPGGLDLRDGNSYSALVNRNSTTVYGLKRVEPGSPHKSYLFEKINSASPQDGQRMPPSVALSANDQALLRDWILSLESTYENYIYTELNTTNANPNASFNNDIDGNGIINGLEYANYQMVNLTPEGSTARVEYSLNPDFQGARIHIQRSLDLTTWTIIGSYTPQETWQSASIDIQINSSSNSLEINDHEQLSWPRFYRLVITPE